jgi:hypothetical protein
MGGVWRCGVWPLETARRLGTGTGTNPLPATGPGPGGRLQYILERYR